MSQRRMSPHAEAHPHGHPHLHASSASSATAPAISRRRVLRGGLAAGALAGLSRLLGRGSAAAAADPRQIYLAPDDHTDYIWSAGETTYRDGFLEMIDWYLDQIDADAAAQVAAPYQTRWNCDGSFWLWTYERNRSPAAFDRLMARIKDGHISAPLNALCLCQGGAPVEAVLRGMAYSGRLERRYNTRFQLAYAIENQTLPYGLGALWAGAGARYSWKGVCACATQVPNPGDRQHEIYWWAGPDGSRLLMKWHSFFNDNQSLGGYAEARRPSEAISFVEGNTNFLSRYAYRIIGIFGYGWDDIKTLLSRSQLADLAQQQSNANRQITVSNQQDFFEAFATRYGADLPTLATSFGNEWDLDCAVMAEVNARCRRAVERLRAAEALATLVALKQPSFLNGRSTARDLAFTNLGLFYEHDWAGAPTTQLTQERIAWQKRITTEIEQYVYTLAADATSALGALIPAGASPRFFVFNPLGWVRTDSADLPYSAAGAVTVVDLTTGQEVPSQRVTVNGTSYLRVLATDIPAVGYKTFEVRAGAGQSFASGAPSASGNTLEHEHYRLTLNTGGAITSLLDKGRGNREFVSGSLNDLGAGSGTLAVENAGPVSATLRATVTSGGLKRTVRVTLTRGSRRIDIRNTIDEGFDTVQTWGFGFNLTGHSLRHEEVGAVVLARLTSDGGHYSPRNARYDWLTLNHFADLSASDVGITLANADCAFMQYGQSSVGTLDTSQAALKILAGGGVNGYHTIRNQGGDTSFLQRFSIQTHGAYDQAAAMRLGLEAHNPLVAGAVSGGSGYPANSYSFVTLDNPDVLLWALKPADDGIGFGVVLRLWNMRQQAASCAITTPAGAISAAQQISHIETPIAAAVVGGGALNAQLAANQIASYRLDTITPPEPGKLRTYLPGVRR